MARKRLPRATDAELSILSVLWQRGPSTVLQVYETLNFIKASGYTTILKFMQIMHGKGLLQRDDSRKTHVYVGSAILVIGLSLLLGGWPAMAAKKPLREPIAQGPAEPGLSKALIRENAELNKNSTVTITSPATRKLAFRVVDALTGKPITGMHLRVISYDEASSLPGGSYETDQNGRASLEYPDRDLTQLTIWTAQEGYPNKTITWRVRAGDTIPLTYLFKAEPGIAIGGIVLDGSNRGIEGARVYINGPGLDKDPNAREHLAMRDYYETTDQEGKWRCTRVPKDFASDFSFTVRHPDFAENNFLTDAFPSGDFGPGPV